MQDKIRWGIIGAGGIAHAFADGLKILPDAELVAVGSRKDTTANIFADKFDIPNRHDSYEKLATDPQVDVVYVATPHAFHKRNSMLCLENDKAVLCEKSFTINAREAQDLISFAREKNLFLMEAMWNRFLPIMKKVRQMLDEGIIGELHTLTADLGFKPDYDPQHRLFNPHLGGGALLDVGVYPVSLASWLFGTPKHISSIALVGPSKVDEQAGIQLGYQDNKMANLFTSIRAELPGEAILYGEEGRLRIHAPIYRPPGITLSRIGEKDEFIKAEQEGNGYNYEAAEVMRCLREGKTESDIMPLDESLAIMETMDRMRAQWGLKYPGEK